MSCGVSLIEWLLFIFLFQRICAHILRMVLHRLHLDICWKIRHLFLNLVLPLVYLFQDTVGIWCSYSAYYWLNDCPCMVSVGTVVYGLSLYSALICLTINILPSLHGNGSIPTRYTLHSFKSAGFDIFCPFKFRNRPVAMIVKPVDRPNVNQFAICAKKEGLLLGSCITILRSNAYNLKL